MFYYPPISSATKTRQHLFPAIDSLYVRSFSALAVLQKMPWPRVLHLAWNPRHTSTNTARLRRALWRPLVSSRAPHSQTASATASGNLNLSRIKVRKSSGSTHSSLVGAFMQHVGRSTGVGPSEQHRGLPEVALRNGRREALPAMCPFPTFSDVCGPIPTRPGRAPDDNSTVTSCNSLMHPSSWTPSNLSTTLPATWERAQHTAGESATRSGDLGPTSLPPRVSPPHIFQLLSMNCARTLANQLACPKDLDAIHLGGRGEGEHVPVRFNTAFCPCRVGSQHLPTIAVQRDRTRHVEGVFRSQPVANFAQRVVDTVA